MAGPEYINPAKNLYLLNESFLNTDVFINHQTHGLCSRDCREAFPEPFGICLVGVCPLYGGDASPGMNAQRGAWTSPAPSNLFEMTELTPGRSYVCLTSAGTHVSP